MLKPKSGLPKKPGGWNLRAIRVNVFVPVMIPEIVPLDVIKDQIYWPIKVKVSSLNNYYLISLRCAKKINFLKGRETHIRRNKKR